MKTSISIALAAILSASSAIPNVFAGLIVQCEHPDQGNYEFGINPEGCDSGSHISDQQVMAEYGPLVFLYSQPKDDETRKYVTAMHATLRDASDYYIALRDPKVSTEEKEAFEHAVFAMANQESFWSQYRRGGDGRIKALLSDDHYAFGMMQIDSRSFLSFDRSEQAWDLIDNVVEGLGVFYPHWVNAARESCVGGASNWQNRSRAAYSAYNSGSQYCRWQSDNDPFSANDQGYYQKYKEELWKQYVQDTHAPAPVDVACLIEKKASCPAPASQQPTAEVSP